MTQIDDDAARRAERARRVGLFRYELIQEVIDPALSTRQRGAVVRGLAAGEHTDPFGAQVRVSRATIDRWTRAWRGGGFEALVPRPAKVTARTPAEVLAVAAALKRENPGRTAAQVARVLRAQAGWAPSERTLQRHFVALALHDGLGGDDGRDGAPRRCSAGSRPTGATSCGSATPCTARRWAGARPTCSPSSTTAPGR